MLLGPLRPHIGIGRADAKLFHQTVIWRRTPARGQSQHGITINNWQLKRSLKFDLRQAEIVGDPEANRMRSRATRAPYQA
jgi:hypothetical protein